jgi:hypothetical protein
MPDYKIDDPGFRSLPPDIKAWERGSGGQYTITPGRPLPLNTGIDFNRRYNLDGLGPWMPGIGAPQPPPFGGPPPQGSPGIRAPEVPIGGPGPRGGFRGIEPWLGNDPRYRQQPPMGIEPWLGHDPTYRQPRLGIEPWLRNPQSRGLNFALPTILAMLQRSMRLGQA